MMVLNILSFIAESWLLFAYKAVAEKRNRKEYSYGLVKITCSTGDQNKFISAIREIKEFDPKLHDNFLKTVKRIIIVDSKGSNILYAKGTILISASDQSHLATKTHLAGWLLYYYTLLQSVREARLIFWTKEKYRVANENGKQLRNDFLSNKKKPNQQVDPIVTTPVDGVEAQSTQGHP